MLILSIKQNHHFMCKMSNKKFLYISEEWTLTPQYPVSLSFHTYRSCMYLKSLPCCLVSTQTVSNPHIAVLLTYDTWQLAFEVVRHHFRLHWISGQAFYWFVLLYWKYLATRKKYYEFGLVPFFFRTAFAKILSELSKYCESKQTYREPRRNWTMSTALARSWAEMGHI